MHETLGLHPQNYINRVWLPTPIILELGARRQEDVTFRVISTTQEVGGQPEIYGTLGEKGLGIVSFIPMKDKRLYLRYPL